MQIIANPRRHKGIETRNDGPDWWSGTGLVRRLFSTWPGFEPSALTDSPALAASAGCAQFWLKDESTRLGLGSFKALGGAYAVARTVMQRAGIEGAEGIDALLDGRLRDTAEGLTFLTASAGNHGIAVAAGAQRFGARARIFLNRTVPSSFADRLRALGAEVDLTSPSYDDSLAVARHAGESGQGILLSDTTWPGYETLPTLIMEGYCLLLAEAAEALPAPPTHLFLQAGVGGMACAIAGKARALWGAAPQIVLVEPDRAACLRDSILAGHSVIAPGPVSNMGRLDCKEASLVALRYLSREADMLATISDDEAGAATRLLADYGYPTSESGAAGVAAALGLQAAGIALPPGSRVLCLISEAPA